MFCSCCCSAGVALFFARKEMCTTKCTTVWLIVVWARNTCAVSILTNVTGTVRGGPPAAEPTQESFGDQQALRIKIERDTESEPQKSQSVQSGRQELSVQVHLTVKSVRIKKSFRQGCRNSKIHRIFLCKHNSRTGWN